VWDFRVRASTIFAVVLTIIPLAFLSLGAFPWRQQGDAAVGSPLLLSLYGQSVPAPTSSVPVLVESSPTSDETPDTAETEPNSGETEANSAETDQMSDFQLVMVVGVVVIAGFTALSAGFQLMGRN
jgi:hypothetical protein